MINIEQEFEKCENCTFVKYVENVPENGLWLEFGVSSGGTLREISELTDKPVFGFDCWEGLPEDWLDSNGNARHAKGSFSSAPPNNLKNNCILVNGLFQDTIPKFCSIINDPVAFMHIDCDIYSATKVIFDNFKDRFQNGSIIAFDELCGYDGWQNHEYKAFVEFLNQTGYSYQVLGKRHFQGGVGIRIYK